MTCINKLYLRLALSSVNEQLDRFIFPYCCYCRDQQSFAVLWRRSQLWGFIFTSFFSPKRGSWHTDSKTLLYRALLCSRYMVLNFIAWKNDIYQCHRSHTNAHTQETKSKLHCVNLIWSFPAFAWLILTHSLSRNVSIYGGHVQK